MKIIKLQGGSQGFLMKIEMIITAGRFKQALTEHFYRKSEDFSSLSKVEARKILIDELKWHGRSGEYDSGEDIGNDNIDDYNRIFSSADEWVNKNYPKLED